MSEKDFQPRKAFSVFLSVFILIIYRFKWDLKGKIWQWEIKRVKWKHSLLVTSQCQSTAFTQVMSSLLCIGNIILKALWRFVYIIYLTHKLLNASNLDLNCKQIQVNVGCVPNTSYFTITNFLNLKFKWTNSFRNVLKLR